ncbi:major capsid protein [Microviridae sp.]|nr:major capsid protein [Microviridae sp.]
MERFEHDKSHFNFNAGRIGGLQTLAAIPCVAGDSISIDLEGLFRLSPLRRNLVVDCHVDFFAFYVPFRHIYGSDWTDFLEGGMNESVTFPTATPPTNSNPAYLGTNYANNETFPLWVNGSYIQIWNRYFRSPTDGNELALDYFTANQPDNRAGLPCGPLPVPWSAGVKTNVDISERQVASTGDILDIVDLEQVQQQYGTEINRKYFGERYTDILNHSWGTKVNTDADQRPTLLGHSEWWLSGYDVDGTADQTLGQYSGKSAGIGQFRVGRRFLPEHGSVWVMCLLRFPTIHTKERPYLNTTQQPTYLEIAGDPRMVAAQPPETILSNSYFDTPSSNALGFAPYGQHYRYHPSTVHRDYENVDGFTFLDTIPTTYEQAQYINSTEYDETFQSDALQHWQSQCAIGVKVQSVVPPARQSLFAGV